MEGDLSEISHMLPIHLLTGRTTDSFFSINSRAILSALLRRSLIEMKQTVSKYFFITFFTACWYFIVYFEQVTTASADQILKPRQSLFSGRFILID